MKIAIASSGNTMEAKIDRHFARCTYFALFETCTNEIDFIENYSRSLGSNVGMAIVDYMNNLGVKRIISGEFGLKVKAELDKLKIQMIVIPDHERSIGEIIELLKTNN